jgi:hypothetical protein
MSEIPTTYTPEIRKIAHHVSALRRRLLTWLLVEGLSRVLVVALAMLLVDFLIDWSFRLDFSQRSIMLALMVIGLFASVVYFIVLPLRHRPTDEALILELERQTPEAKNALISAWQFSQASNLNELGISASLIRATIGLGTQAAEAVEPSKLVNLSRWRWNIFMVVVCLLVLASVSIGVASTSLLGIWFNRNLLLGSQTWPQKTYLVVEGLDGDGKIPMVRGEDYKLLVTIDPRSEIQDVDVFFDYRDAGSRYRQKMRRTDQNGVQRFEHTFGTVVSEFRFQVFGGDARTDWLSAKLVEPPGISELELKVFPPTYTGLEPVVLPRGQSPYDILQGSQLAVSGTANKPMQTATLRGPEANFELAITEQTQMATRITAADLIDGKYVFDLVDDMGLTTKHPPGFALRIKEDEPPQVRANTYGVGGLVVSRARIPLRIGIEDQFAVTVVQLQYETKGDTPDANTESTTVPIPEANPFLGEPRISILSRWDLEPLQIPVGASLVFTVTASDNCEPEFNRGESKTFLLRVVTEDELRTDLLRREREQREDFELQITEQINLRTDMEALAIELQQAAIPDSERTLNPSTTLAGARQRQRNLATVLEKIANRFEELLIEAENNRLDEESGRLRERLENQIITPLRDLDLNELKSVEQGLETARLSLAQPQSASAEIEKVIATQETIIAKMNEILTYMVKAEGYQEAINLLRQIERTQQDVLEITDEQRRKRIQSIFEGQENTPPK